LRLAETNRTAYDALVARSNAALRHDRAAFVAQVMKSGSLPCDSFLGIGDAQRQLTRCFILRARAGDTRGVAKALWGDAETIASARPFYP
jgi:hypothetical protein